MVDSFGGQRNVIKPPERGVFALDHDGECKPYMKVYFQTFLLRFFEFVIKCVFSYSPRT